MQGPDEKQNHESTIGKSIVIKGEISATGPIYIYGRVEGSINAPDQRVTVGKEAKVKANISAREIVIMGDVRGKLDAGSRVEIRSSGSLTGDLAADRISIEEGAILKGTIDIRGPKEKDNVEAQEELDSAEEPREAASADESEFDREALAAAAS